MSKEFRWRSFPILQSEAPMRCKRVSEKLRHDAEMCSARKDGQRPRLGMAGEMKSSGWAQFEGGRMCWRSAFRLRPGQWLCAVRARLLHLDCKSFTGAKAGLKALALAVVPIVPSPGLFSVGFFGFSGFRGAQRSLLEYSPPSPAQFIPGVPSPEKCHPQTCGEVDLRKVPTSIPS